MHLGAICSLGTLSALSLNSLICFFWCSVFSQALYVWPVSYLRVPADAEHNPPSVNVLLFTSETVWSIIRYLSHRSSSGARGRFVQQRELEDVKERRSWLCFNLNWTITSMWRPAGALHNPEVAGWLCKSSRAPATWSVLGLRSSPFARICLGHCLSQHIQEA